MSRIAEAVGGDLHAPLGDGPVTDIALDSRKPHLQPDTLFVALRGERHDGHRYLPDLVARGVRHALVSAPAPPELRERLNTILVPDTLDALQRL
ncbi:MAG TPA: Mur ligase domain-containing protein, partial [Flavobacteriales bacterium]|nr:Mur ligase domain-containing protein [Flavobacteriales bacterium]